MPCIHGLDELNCPICKITDYTIPEKLNNSKNVRNNPLKPGNHIFDKKITEKSIFQDRFKKKNDLFQLDLINPISNNPFLNELPNFKNKMFLKRLKDIDLKNPDKHGISKKMSLESPEWKINQNDDKEK